MFFSKGHRFQMKKIVFLCSHLYSGSSALYQAMNNHQRIQGYKLTSTPNSYINPLNLLDLTEHTHKLSNRSAIYMDELLHNRSFYTPAAYQKCQFIYIVREPEAPLNFLVAGEKKKPHFAVRQYLFRLRRLCEMARHTPGAILLTWNDLQSGAGIPLVEKYLGLKEHIPYEPAMLAPYKMDFTENLINMKMLKESQDAYEKYLFFLKKQKLIYLQ
jgi:hypothetical protein